MAEKGITEKFKEKEERSEKNSLKLLTLPSIKRGKMNAAHPVITFIYFLGIAIVTMFTLNPIILGISLTLSLCCTGMFIGMKKLLISLAYSFPIFIVMAIINPIFVHKGETILFFLNDNPVTQESIIYGVCSATMLISVFYWFRCYSMIMTSDKFVFLFGRVMPQLALILSMSLAFIPKLKKQYKYISAIQKSMGMYTSKSITDRLLFRFRILNSLIGWMLENSVETSDSMHARGYGLKGRSSYAIYKFRSEDKISLYGIIALLLFVMFCLGLTAKVAFYPSLHILDFSLSATLAYIAFTLLCSYAVFQEIKENITWHFLVSKI